MSERKALIKNSFLYVVLGFLPLAANFFLAPVYSRYISPEEYGIISLSIIFQGFLTLFISLGLEAGFARIYFDYHKRDKLVKALMSTTILAILAGALVFWIILFFAGDFLFSKYLQNDQFTYQKYGNLVFFITLSTTLHTVFLSYYRNKEYVLKYSLVALSFFFTSVAGILIGIVYFKAEAMGNIVGRALGMSLVVGLLILLYYSRNSIQFRYKFFKASLIYSLPLIPYLFLLMLYNNVDKLMVERYFPLETLGLYNFGFQLASVISVFIYAVFNAVSPRIYKLFTEPSEKTFREIQKIQIVFHLLVLFVIVAGIAGIVPVLNILISEKYRVIQDYVSLLILVYVFQLYYVLYTTPLFFYNKTKCLPWISFVVLIVGVVSNIIFIPLLGIYGVCAALFFTKMSQFFVAYLFVRHYKYNSESYLSLYKNHIVSSLVTIIFVICFILNFHYEFISVYLLNLIPLIVFSVCTIVLYSNNWQLFKETFAKFIPSIAK